MAAGKKPQSQNGQHRIHSLPDRVTDELPPGEIRTPGETQQARNFFERNRDDAEQWYEQRTGEAWPEDATNAGHPQPARSVTAEIRSLLNWNMAVQTHRT